ncbi:MAG: hypothetical protein AAB450_00820 [Patescibacteria group bacterium]
MHPIISEVKKREKAGKLCGAARAMIENYLALPLGAGPNARPNCPYFNNRRRKIRGSLRVVKGKGTPEEIAEEAMIDAKFARVKTSGLPAGKLKEFLIKNDLGIDCSGFAYHVLNTLCQEKTGKKLQSFVKPLRAGFIGALLGRLRPAENIGVIAFADRKNSSAIKISEAGPGDIIIFLGTGKDKNYNHILVITAVDRTNSDTLATRISYAHSYAWPSDGVVGHGVREGEILVRGEDLIGGTWKEKGVTGEENYTFESARNAIEVFVRRLNFNL